jgi:hypothetical protein
MKIISSFEGTVAVKNIERLSNHKAYEIACEALNKTQLNNVSYYNSEIAYKDSVDKFDEHNMNELVDVFVDFKEIK